MNPQRIVKHPGPPPRRRPRGFSIVEVLVVVLIMGILIAICAPTYQVALEQSRADVAAANLRAIWAAERLYWLTNQTYTADLSQLENLGLIDPTVVSGSSVYSYSVTAADSSTFGAMATRIGSSAWSGSINVDQTGSIYGTISAAGRSDIQPGFE